MYYEIIIFSSKYSAHYSTPKLLRSKLTVSNSSFYHMLCNLHLTVLIAVTIIKKKNERKKTKKNFSNPFG